MDCLGSRLPMRKGRKVSNEDLRTSFGHNVPFGQSAEFLTFSALGRDSSSLPPPSEGEQTQSTDSEQNDRRGFWDSNEDLPVMPIPTLPDHG